MSTALTRWLAPWVVAAGLVVAGLAPTAARASDGDDLVRVIVDVADVIYRSGYPYYRYGSGYGYGDRLVVVRDRYGHPVYYRTVPRSYRYGPPYGNAYGYYRNGAGHHHKCKHGNCRGDYYDARYGRRYYGYDERYYRGYDRYHRDDDRYWDGRRWRDDD